MKTISLTYDPATRILSSADSDAGSVVDNGTTALHLDPLPDCTMDLVYGIVLRDGGTILGHPFARLGEDGTAILYSDVLRACTGGTLPVSLRITYPDNRTETSRPCILKVRLAPGADIESTIRYADLVLTRNSSMAWIPRWRYATGAAVSYDDTMWIATKPSVGSEPSNKNPDWVRVVGYAENSDALDGIKGNVQAQLDGLQEGIDKEEAARKDADDLLQGAINTEAQERAKGDATLQSNIDKETSARAKGDATLQSNIDAEASARSSADATLQGNIDKEEAARKGADTTLQQNIDKETQARASRDEALQGAVDKIAGDLQAETSARSSADQTLQSNIDAEAQARTSADTALEKAIDAEETARKGADEGLQSNISSEASARTSADATLQSNIDVEAQARKDADATLQGNIDAEAQARTSADATLRSDLNAEISARSGADEAMQGDIDRMNAVLDTLGTASVKNVGTSAGQVPVLDSGGKLPIGIVPETAISRFAGTSTTKAGLSALTAQDGDWAKVTEDGLNNGTYILSEGTWIKMGNPDMTFAGLSGNPLDNAPLKGIIDGLSGDISDETSARSSADATLQSNIDAEAKSRREGDSSLQGAIDAEAQARASRDEALQGAIDAEALARAGSDQTLQSNIDKEAQARAGTDQTLQSNIDAEASARSSADTTLQQNIDKVADDLESESSARTSADSGLQEAINTEAQTRASADTTLQSNIDKVAGDLSAETSARSGADTTLQQNIDKEAQARASADEGLSGRLDDVEDVLDTLGSAATKDAGTSAGQVPVLGTDGKLDTDVLPEVLFSNSPQLVGTVDTVAGLDSLQARTGDWAKVVNDGVANGSYMRAGDTWVRMGNPSPRFDNIVGEPSWNQALADVLDGKVSKTGDEVIEGYKIFMLPPRAQVQGVSFIMKNPNLGVNATPPENYWNRLSWLDKNNAEMGGLQFVKNADGYTFLEHYIIRDQLQNWGLQLGIDPYGISFATAPHPGEGANGNNIATAWWVNNRPGAIIQYVGNDHYGGVKFANGLTINWGNVTFSSIGRYSGQTQIQNLAIPYSHTKWNSIACIGWGRPSYYADGVVATGPSANNAIEVHVYSNAGNTIASGLTCTYITIGRG